MGARFQGWQEISWDETRRDFPKVLQRHRSSFAAGREDRVFTDGHEVIVHVGGESDAIDPSTGDFANEPINLDPWEEHELLSLDKSPKMSEVFTIREAAGEWHEISGEEVDKTSAAIAIMSLHPGVKFSDAIKVRKADGSSVAMSSRYFTDGESVILRVDGTIGGIEPHMFLYSSDGERTDADPWAEHEIDKLLDKKDPQGI